MKIGIDIDNVISDTFRIFLERFNSFFARKVQYEEIFDFHYLVKYAGVEKKQAELFIEETIHSDKFHEELAPFEEAVEAIRNWSNRGYTIHYITARPPTIRYLTANWLMRFGFMVPHATLDMLDPDKYKEDTVFKKEAVARIGIDILIEDSREIARVVEIPVFLFDRPWNKGKMPKNVKRVDSWKEINKDISNMSSSRLPCKGMRGS